MSARSTSASSIAIRLGLVLVGSLTSLTFGAGAHFCLGASLARAEAAEMIGQLVGRFPDLELAGEPSFAPHFNMIGEKGLIGHFMHVRADHTARAVENSVWFVRGNNVVLNPAKSGITRNPGVGYGDSYVIDPAGEILVRSRRHVEDFIMVDVDPTVGPGMAFGLTKSAWSHREFGRLLDEATKGS